MRQIATVTSKNMVTIPSKIRRKYNIIEGSKVEFVELDGSLLIVPVKSLRDWRGAGKSNSAAIIAGIRELDKEHREAR